MFCLQHTISLRKHGVPSFLGGVWDCASPALEALAFGAQAKDKLRDAAEAKSVAQVQKMLLSSPPSAQRYLML